MLNYKPTVPKFLPHFPTCYNRKVKLFLEFQGPSAVAHTCYLRSCHCPAQCLSFSAALAFFLFWEPQSHFPRAITLAALSAWNAHLTLQGWLLLLDIYLAPWPNVSTSSIKGSSLSITSSREGFVFLVTLRIDLFIHLLSACLPGERVSSMAAETLPVWFEAPGHPREAGLAQGEAGSVRGCSTGGRVPAV